MYHSFIIRHLFVMHANISTMVPGDGQVTGRCDSYDCVRAHSTHGATRQCTVATVLFDIPTARHARAHRCKHSLSRRDICMMHCFVDARPLRLRSHVSAVDGLSMRMRHTLLAIVISLELSRSPSCTPADRIASSDPASRRAPLPLPSPLAPPLGLRPHTSASWLHEARRSLYSCRPPPPWSFDSKHPARAVPSP